MTQPNPTPKRTRRRREATETWSASSTITYHDTTGTPTTNPARAAKATIRWRYGNKQPRRTFTGPTAARDAAAHQTLLIAAHANNWPSDPAGRPIPTTTTTTEPVPTQPAALRGASPSREAGIPIDSQWVCADPLAMGDSRRLLPDATTRALRALVHPVAILALSVLIINDHVLKDAYPGFITGKLSDVAGLALFPILLAAIFGLLRLPDRLAFVAAAVTTAIWFTGMKTTTMTARFTESLAEVFVPRSTVVVDPTDLIALPMVLVALAILWSTPRTAASAPRSHMRGRRVLEMSALILGAVASMATSCDESAGITDLIVQGPVVAVQVDYGDSYSSTDGFASWERAEQTQLDERSLEACLPDETCFRIDGGPYVMMSTNGGPWTTAWEIPAGRAKFLERYGGSCDPYVVHSYDIAVTEGPDGPVILVAMGDDGLLRRNADGAWDRGVLGRAEPLDDWGTNIQRELLIVVSVGMLLAAGTALVSKRKLRRDGRIRIGAWSVVGLIILLAGAAYGFPEEPNDSILQLAVVITSLGWAGGLAAIAAIWTRIIEVAGRSARQLLTKTTAVIIAATAIAALAFLAWSGGSIAVWDTAFGVALLSFVIGVGVLTAVVSASPDRVDQPTEEPPSGEANPMPDDHMDQAHMERTQGAIEEGGVRIVPSGRLWAYAGGCWLGAGGSWLGAQVLWVFGLVALPVPFLTPVLVFAAAYFAARASGHRSAVSRAIVAITASIVSVPFTNGLLFPSVWLGTVIAVRARTRWAWLSRLALLCLSVAVVRVFHDGGSAMSMTTLLSFSVVGVAMPFIVIATDAATDKLVRRVRGEADTRETEPTAADT